MSDETKEKMMTSSTAAAAAEAATSTTILFSKDFVKQIESTHRLPPTSVGVKRIRPSNKAILKELRRQIRAKKQKKQSPQDDDDQNCCKDKNDKLLELPEKNNSDVDDVKDHVALSDAVLCDYEDTVQSEIKLDDLIKDESSQNTNYDLNNDQIRNTKEDKNHENCIIISTGRQKQDPFYHQLEINPTIIQEEIAEMKHEDRRAYNNLPAILSPPMTYQAYLHGLIPFNHNKNDNMDRSNCHESNIIVIDDELAKRWAQALRKVINNEEMKRNKENLRPLVYKLMPEVWKRLRPLPSSQNGVIDDESMDIEIFNSSQPLSRNQISINEEKGMIHCRNIRSHESKQYRDSWYNKSHEIVFECLYKHFSNFHVSCGAKFGCDYLIYDGSRMERHAFAGLRIICANKKQIHYETVDDELFPLPTPYDLSGYVRGLNTAGKLALLAMVVQCEDNENGGSRTESFDGASSIHSEKFHVAIVDLALEKVIASNNHSSLFKIATKKIGRKEVGLNLGRSKT